MDKYEYKVSAEEIKDLIARGEYGQAAEIADTIDWRRVKSVMMLCTISDLYKINRRYEDARNMLLLAYERRPGGRTICYSLCELCIKTEEYVQALNYYKEFVQVAPKDPGRYVLQYKLYEAQDVSLEERIGVLEELKKRDYREKWAYELAYLYHRVGLETKCVEECDEMILWFGEGRYVVKAMELKMLHQPLSPEQQEKYDRRFEEAGDYQGYGPEQDTNYSGENGSGQNYTQENGTEGNYVEGNDLEGGYAEGSDDIAYDRDPALEGQYGDAGYATDGTGDRIYQDAGQYGYGTGDAGYQDAGQYGYGTGDAEYQDAGQYGYGTGDTGYQDAGQYGYGTGDTGYQDNGQGYGIDTYYQDGVAGYGSGEPGTEEMYSQDNPVPEPGHLQDGNAYYQEPGADYGTGEPGMADAAYQGTPGPYGDGTGQDVEPMEDGTGEGQQTGYTPEEMEIQVKTMDVSRYNTINLQAELAAGLREVLKEERKEEQTFSQPVPAPMTGTDVSQGTHDREEGQNAGGQVPEAMQEEGEAPGKDPRQSRTGTIQGDAFGRDQEEVESSEVFFGETEELGGLPQEEPVPEETTGAAGRTATQQVSPARSGKEEEVLKAQPPRELAGVLSQESDGQLSLVMPESERIEKQITGQMNIEDVLAEWEQMKKENARKQKEEVRKRVLQQTGDMFTEFEASVRDGLLERLEGGLPVDLEALAGAAPAGTGENADEVDGQGDSGNEQDIFSQEDPGDFEAGEDESYDTYEEEEFAGEDLAEEDFLEEDTGEEDFAEEDLVEGGFTEEDFPEGESQGEELYDDLEMGQTGEGLFTETEETQAGEELSTETEETQAGEEFSTETEETQAGEELSTETEEAQAGEELSTETEETQTGEEPFHRTGAAEGQEEVSAGEEAPEEREGFPEGQATAREGRHRGAGTGPELRGRGKVAGKITRTPDGALRMGIRIPPKPSVERDQAKIRSLTREEKELYGPFIQSRAAREQLVKAIDNISMAAFTGNIIITGEEGMDTITLAKNMIREVQVTDSNFSGKVAKISGRALNKKDVESTLKRLKSGALIIEKAPDMEEGTTAALHKALQQESMGIIIVLEGTRKAINKLLEKDPELAGCFTARVDIEALSNDMLVAFGRQYAREKEYFIDDLGVLALHTRVDELQTSDHVVTVMEVKEIVDEAIRHANRKTMGHFFDILLAKRYDEEDMIILSEKDFV